MKKLSKMSPTRKLVAAARAAADAAAAAAACLVITSLSRNTWLMQAGIWSAVRYGVKDWKNGLGLVLFAIGQVFVAAS